MSKVALSPDETLSNVCGGCNGEVKAGDKAMQCDACNRWLHNSCGVMPDDLYKILTKYENKCTGVKWFCKNCELHFSKIKVDVRIMSEKQLSMEIKQLNTEKGLSEIIKDVMELKKDFSDFVKERKTIEESSTVKVDEQFEEIKEEITEIKKSYSSVVGGTQVNGGGSSGPSSSVNVPVRTIQLEVSEVMERDKRKNNLVIFGIDETNDEQATREKVVEIVKATGLDDNKIKYFGRVGRLVQGAKPRMVRVVCEDAEIKRKCLKAATKFKTLEGYKNIYISLDLTKTQQHQDKILREKLKEIRITYKEARINNNEIIIFENGNRKVLYSQLT